MHVRSHLNDCVVERRAPLVVDVVDVRTDAQEVLCNIRLLCDAEIRKWEGQDRYNGGRSKHRLAKMTSRVG